jgi:hypothetical protein
MSALVQLINCQLFDPILSLELNSHMLETNNHFTPELLIFVPGDLTNSNIAHTAPLLECERPTLFGQYGNFFYLFFFVLVQGLLVLGYCHLPC